MITLLAIACGLVWTGVIFSAGYTIGHHRGMIDATITVLDTVRKKL